MTGYAQILANPALLKLELMMRGLRIPDAVDARLRQRRVEMAAHALFGSTGDLDLTLPGGTWASVPVAGAGGAATPWELHEVDDGYAVRLEGSEHPGTRVRIHPPSDFFNHVTSSGIPFGRIGTVHGPYMALSPTSHCTFLNKSDRCRFCGVAQTDHGALPVEDVVEAVRVARSEHRINMVYLSVGHIDTEDGGVRFLEPYVHAIKKHFGILVAIDALPPKDDAWIDRTYAMGADAISYNLEIYDPERFERICPGPARHVGRQRFFDALGYAATVFPSGGVACHLMLGVEPVESTHEGIEALARMGVVPIMPVYRPFKGRDMRHDRDVELFPPSIEDLTRIHAHLDEVVRRHRLRLHLVRDIALVTTPIESRFFNDRQGVWQSLRDRLGRSTLARRTSTHMSDLRRKLRVRRVHDTSS